MNETETYAGLTPVEANEALCVWCNEHQNAHLSYSFGTMFDHKTNDFLSPFTASHDSIHRVLDAMNEAERVAFRRALIDVIADAQPAGKGANLAVLALFATPAQKCVAALRAMGLGKEEAECLNP